jgi:hypothetical protein
VAAGNIGVHSRVEARYRCRECRQTFSASKGTAVYGLKQDKDVFVKVTTLLAHGCPVRAAALAFGLDERTVQAWLARSGQHCQRVHEALIGTAQLDLGQVQADELKVKTQGGQVWMAMALCVPFRLWLGGVVSRQRDLSLIRALVALIACVALCRPLLLAADGLSSYVRAFQDAFRSPLPRRTPGRPRLRPWDELAIVQVVKQRSQGVLTIQRRIVPGAAPLVQRLVQHTQGGGLINTAYIERLNASFRQSFAPLIRRGRCLARLPHTLHHGMFLVGCVYNFCSDHDSLALKLYLPHSAHRWVRRTPAMAAGLTPHRWSMLELRTFKVPPSPFVPPKRRGRPPKRSFQVVLP